MVKVDIEKTSMIWQIFLKLTVSHQNDEIVVAFLLLNLNTLMDLIGCLFQSDFITNFDYEFTSYLSPNRHVLVQSNNRNKSNVKSIQSQQ